MKKTAKYLLNSLIAGLYFLLLTTNVQAQGNDFWSRVRYGGGLGLGFGNNSTQIQVSPSALYDATDNYALGAGLSFTYSKFRESSLTAYGASLLQLYTPFRPVQLSTEFEQLRVNRKIDLGTGDIRDSYWLPALYVGIGYVSGNFSVGIRYDVLYKEGKSLYSDPWLPFVRVYF